MIVVDRDEHPRPETTLEALAGLKPAFKADGTVTAGNTSGINDGAAALLLVEADRAAELGLRPLARVVVDRGRRRPPGRHGDRSRARGAQGAGPGGDLAGELDVDRDQRGVRVPVRRVHGRAGLDPARVNPNGGAIALGHPLGASGARLVTMLVHELERTGGHYGLATMCIGVGQGIATVVERVEA